MSVYFAESGRYTKIGFSADPIARAATLTTSGIGPDDLRRRAPVDLLGWIPGHRWRESQVQAAFIDHRVKGEWFHRIDRNAIHDLIWDDPRGIDVHRMSAAAVLYAVRYPSVTRDEIAAAGVPVAACEFSDMRIFGIAS